MEFYKNDERLVLHKFDPFNGYSRYWLINEYYFQSSGAILGSYVD